MFIVIPMAFALFLGFTKWNVIGSLNWVGFANWSRFFGPLAHHSLLVTFELAGLSRLVQTPLAMALGGDFFCSPSALPFPRHAPAIHQGDRRVCTKMTKGIFLVARQARS